MPIKGVHAAFSSTDAPGARAFIRDKLGLKAHDVGGGFLIFDVPDAEAACHEAEDPAADISFYCDDLDATMEELKSRGVRFVAPVKEETWGRTTTFEMPGAGEVMLYQPKYTRR